MEKQGQWKHQALLERHKLYFPDAKVERIPGTDRISIEWPEGKGVIIEPAEMLDGSGLAFTVEHIKK